MPDRTLPPATWPRRLIAGAALAALLVGCAGPGPAASSSSPGTTAPPTPAPSARPSPSSAGPDADAGAAVDAFRAFVQTDQSFHLAGDMLMTVGDVTLQAAIATDVSGGDEQGTIDVRGPGVSIRLAIVLVDGKAYLRVANRAWQTVPGAPAFSNPLGGLHVEGLVPVDKVNVAGVRTHHLRVENPEGFNGQTLSGNTITDLTISSSSIDIYITDDGVPLTAIGEFVGTGTFGGKRGPVTAKLRYDFSKFGATFDIIAPIAASP